MNETSSKDQVGTTAHDHHNMRARIQEMAHHLSDTLHHTHPTHPEPTVMEIVNQVAALHPGESCELRLDAHLTRIGNVEELLTICLRQIGRTVTMAERQDGEDVVLIVTVTDDSLPHAWSALGDAI